MAVSKPSTCALRSDHPASSGLIACWPMVENSGQTIYDYSGNGNNFSLQAAASWVSGPYGARIELDGAQRALASDNDLFSFTDGAGNDEPFTFIIGFRLSSFANIVSTLFAKVNSLTPFFEYLIYSDIALENLYFQCCLQAGRANSIYVRLPFTSFLGDNLVLAATYGSPLESTSGLALWLNGSKQSPVEVTSGVYNPGMSNTSAQLSFGGTANAGNYFDGDIDFIHVYNKRLDDWLIEWLANDPFTFLRQSNIYNIAYLHDVAFNRRGFSAADTGLILKTLAAAATAGDRSLTLNNVANLAVDQNVAWLDSASRIKMGTIKSISAPDVELYSSIPSNVNNGAAFSNIYDSNAHPHNSGYFAIGDYIEDRLSDLGVSLTAGSVFIGDSWLYQGYSSGQGIIRRLEFRLGLSFVNKAVSGRTSKDILDAFDFDLSGLYPDFIIILCGANDFSAGVTQADYEANIRKIIGKIFDRDAIPILLTSQVGPDSSATQIALSHEYAEMTLFSPSFVLSSNSALSIKAFVIKTLSFDAGVQTEINIDCSIPLNL